MRARRASHLDAAVLVGEHVDNGVRQRAGSEGGTSLAASRRRDCRVARDVGRNRRRRTRERLREDEAEALTAERGRDGNLRAEQLMRSHLVGDDAEDVDSRFVEPQARMQEAVLQRVGSDQAQPGAGRGMDRGPRAKQGGQPLAWVVTADEDDDVIAIGWVRLDGGEDTVRNDAVVVGDPAAGRLGGHRRHRDPRVDAVHQKAPEVKTVTHPAEVSVRVMGGDDGALR